MRFFIILAFALNYSYSASKAGGGASAGPGGAAPAASRNRAPTTDSSTTAVVTEASAVESVLSPNICARPEFPNYFAQLEPNRAKQLINESLSSVLNHLKVPYAENDQILYDGFFRKIQEIVNRKAPGSIAYISGGMVRSLLGYIYKKMHNMMLDVADFTPRANPKQVIEEVLYDIIHGKRRTDALLSEFAEDEEGGKKVSLKGENLPNLGTRTKFTPKELTPLQTLGIGSDFDVLIEFPEGTTDAVKAQTINAVETFINSAQKHFGMEADQSELKRVLVPDADVGEYSKQIDESVKQGGVTIDLLAHPVSGGIMKLPIAHPEIMDDFIQGHLRYIGNSNATDKQTMRGLRALLEIAFLVLDSDSAQVMIAELRRLILNRSLSRAAQEQLRKMIRNGRFGGAGNRFAGGNCMPDGEITALVQELAQELAQKIGRNTLVPEFVSRRSVRNCSVVQNAPTFIPYDDFKKNYTDNGTLYHGTSDVMNFLSMIRNGLVVSSATQGAAAYGYGVYTTKNYTLAEDYAKDAGIVTFLTICDSARIADMAITSHRQHYKAWLATKGITERNFGDSFKGYADEFGIDIIVNTYPLIQNAKAIQLEKNLKSIVEADRALVRRKVRVDGIGVTIGKVIRTFNAAEGYGKIYPPSEDDLSMVADIKAQLESIPFYEIFDLNTIDISKISELAKNVKNNYEKLDLLKGILHEVQIEQLKEIPNFNDLLKNKEYIEFLQQLIGEGVASKLEVRDLQLIKGRRCPALPIQPLKDLIRAGVIDKLDMWDLIGNQYIPDNLGFDEQTIPFLKQLVEAGVIEKLKIWELKDIPDNLSTEKAEALATLFRAGVIDKLTVGNLEYIPDNLSTEKAEALVTLFRAGVIDKLTVRDLEYIPDNLSTEKAEALTTLFRAGIIDKLDAWDLEYLSNNLSREKARVLVTVLQGKDKIEIYKLKKILNNLSEENVQALVILLEAGVITQLFSGDLEEPFTNLSRKNAEFLVILFKKGIIIHQPNVPHYIPVDLSPVVNQIDDLQQLIHAGVIHKPSASHLERIPTDLSPVVNQIDFLKQLIDAGVIHKPYGDDLEDIPADLSFAVSQIDKLKKRVRAQEGMRLRLQDLPVS